MRTVAAVVALVTCVHAGLWALLQRQHAVADIDGPLASVSYSPLRALAASRQRRPADRRADPRRSEADRPYTRAIRTYSSTGGVELVPPIAAEFGLKVTVGIWIDKNEAAQRAGNRRSAIALAKRYSNVNAIVVGNETMLRADKTVDELIDDHPAGEAAEPGAGDHRRDLGRLAWRHVRCEPKRSKIARKLRARRSTSSPRTSCPTGKASPAKQAVDHTITTYDKLRRAHPGKRIVIAEFGWPSAGYNMHDAEPGRIEQAHGPARVRRARRRLGIDYNIIEAFDQPWKTIEGSVGAYWGTVRRLARRRSSPGPGRSAIPTTGRSPGSPCCSGCCCRCRCWRGRARPPAKPSRWPSPTNAVGAWAAIVVRVLERPLFRARRRLRARPRPRAAGAAGPDRARAHRGDRRDRVRPRAAPPDLAAALPAPEGFCAEGVDPRPGLSRAAGDAEGRRSMRWRGSTTRISNAWSSSTTRPTRPSGGRSRSIAARSASASSSSTRTSSTATRPARCASRSRTPRADAEIIGVHRRRLRGAPDWLKDLVAGLRRPARSA